MELLFETASTFKKIIDAIRELIVDANFDCTPNGISLQAMDSAHVSLCSLQINASGLVKYNCPSPISIGINIPTLAKILKCAGNEDQLCIKNEPNENVLTLIFKSATHDRISEFGLPQMNIDSEHLGIPDIDYACSVHMPAVEFQRLVRDLSVLGDACMITCNSDGIRFSVSGDMGVGNTLLTGSGSEADIRIHVQETVSLTFSLRYLNMFAKANNLSSEVHLRITPNSPIVVEYTLSEMGFLRFYLAPKFEDTD